jgi:hypothetical protein
VKGEKDARRMRKVPQGESAAQFIRRTNSADPSAPKGTGLHQAASEGAVPIASAEMNTDFQPFTECVGVLNALSLWKMDTTKVLSTHVVQPLHQY